MSHGPRQGYETQNTLLRTRRTMHGTLRMPSQDLLAKRPGPTSVSLLGSIVIFVLKGSSLPQMAVLEMRAGPLSVPAAPAQSGPARQFGRRIERNQSIETLRYGPCCHTSTI